MRFSRDNFGNSVHTRTSLPLRTIKVSKWHLSKTKIMLLKCEAARYVKSQRSSNVLKTEVRLTS